MLISFLNCFSGLALLIATISPLLVLLWKKNYSAEKVDMAKKLLFLSVSVVSILCLAIFGFSLMIDTWNIIVLVLTFICIFVLSIFSWRLKPMFLGVLIGLPSSIGLTMISVVFFLSHIFDSTTQPPQIKIKEIGNFVYCKQSINEYGIHMEAYKDYILLKKRLVPEKIFGRENEQLSGKAEHILESCYEAFSPSQ